jgi:hypothetical protein
MGQKINTGFGLDRVKIADKYGNDLQGVVKCTRLVAAASTDNPTNIASSALSILRRITGYNAKAGVLYIKLYDKAPSSAPAAADTPVLVYAIGASQTFSLPGDGFRFTNGIAYRIVTGSADSDNTAVAANDIVGMNIFWEQ